jgi:hypothetical protein
LDRSSEHDLLVLEIRVKPFGRIDIGINSKNPIVRMKMWVNNEGMAKSCDLGILVVAF